MIAVSTIVIVTGTLMYVIEGPPNGFSSIPKSIYWTIVTITTVGYGDIAPQTPLGQFVASLLMIMGYAIIAVPTGIVSVELNRTQQAVYQNEKLGCPNCGASALKTDKYCHECGFDLRKT